MRPTLAPAAAGKCQHQRHIHSLPREVQQHRHILHPPAVSYAASAVPASVVTRTVVKLTTPEDWQLVLTANDLVAEVFYNTADNPVVDAINFNSYRVRSAAQTLSLHMGPSRSHATIVAFNSSSSSSTAPHQQLQHQQPWRTMQQQEDQQQKAIGVVNVSLMKATPSIATAAACKPGTPFAMITNMAVCPELRRRGVSHMLMQAAVKAALIDLDISPPFALLLAYKYYEPAIRLYESWGFQATPWVDPTWQEDAEKGRAVRQRRIMLVKPLSGPGIKPSPLNKHMLA